MAAVDALKSLSEAFDRAQVGDWRGSQEICGTLGNIAPPIGVIARLDILICQYHLGHNELIPERALPLLQHLPPGARMACIGLALLAARKTNSLPNYTHLVLALADSDAGAFDLPSIPTFVTLLADGKQCVVSESIDSALMSEIVSVTSKADGLSEEQQVALTRLANRYAERASRTAANVVNKWKEPKSTTEKPWWKRW